MIENYSAGRYRYRILAKYPEIFDDLILLDEKQLQNRLNALKIFIKFKTTNKSVEFTCLTIYNDYEQIIKQIRL